MKTVFSVFSTIVLTVLTATNAGATELKLNNEKTVIHGAVEGGAKADALAFYVPVANLTTGKTPTDCEFPEDKASPNGAGKFVKIPVELKQGNYNIEAPIKGVRGNCNYTLDTLYVGFDNGKVSVNLSLITKLKSNANDKLMQDAGLDTIAVPAFRDLKTLSCELITAESVGLCETSEGLLPEINYQIGSSPSNYVLDIRNKPRY